MPVLRCENVLPLYNMPAMKSYGLTCLLALLMPALAVPEFSVRVFNEFVAVGDEQDEDPVDYHEGGEQEDSPDNEDSAPKGQLVPPPAPFELLKRTARVPGIVKFVPRLLEKQASQTQRVAPVVARIERVIAQARCVSSISLAVVAPPVQSHAPPMGSSMVCRRDPSELRMPSTSI